MWGSETLFPMLLIVSSSLSIIFWVSVSVLMLNMNKNSLNFAHPENQVLIPHFVHKQRQRAMKGLWWIKDWNLFSLISMSVLLHGRKPGQCLLGDLVWHPELSVPASFQDQLLDSECALEMHLARKVSSLDSLTGFRPPVYLTVI